MIHTNNINKTVKDLENKLNKEFGSSIQRIFTVVHEPKRTETTDGIIEIQIYWCLSLNELNEIQTVLGDNFYVTKGNNTNCLCIWTSYKEEG